MSDIDWGKRSGYDNWISPAYGYHSMADSDWGWKKRGAPAAPAAAAEGEDESSEDDGAAAVAARGPSTASLLSRYYKQQASRYPSYLYRPYVSASRRSPRVSRDRQYGFHSMADSDWGWKKRSAPSVGVNKRHIGSLGERLMQASNALREE